MDDMARCTIVETDTRRTVTRLGRGRLITTSDGQLLHIASASKVTPIVLAEGAALNGKSGVTPLAEPGQSLKWMVGCPTCGVPPLLRLPKDRLLAKIGYETV